ncbi:hypothetical protein [Tessaracoccus sp. OH4464_COT-324]|uniref:hypothetical protein n=1 Tax=Tessaracoccus sp. OH4464_COT-324 TaxID=2491059 RepID=UPI000F63547D|nr:hypothetical protein [Tessaracoccus sp. OH4464_COT-324]RRD47874.1 hypothetical protein EII42_01100 [Tessaracoccus sp. OH4464_COT-324]
MRNLLIVAAALLAACVSRPEPDPAVLRESAPPWDAPRDAISYLDLAGMEHRPIGEDTDPWVLKLQVERNGQRVAIPAMIGVDRLRAVQAVLHTHDAGGDIWLEGPGNDGATLGQFFQLWGVRFDSRCLGDVCEGVSVFADGERVSDPVNLVLRGHQAVEVRAGS